MKKVILLIAVHFLLVSCEKGYLVPEKELPEWLRTSIEKDEQIIKKNPKYMTSYGSWIRYKWHDEYYYDYFNLVSSTMSKPISHIGDTLNYFVNDNNTAYYKEKCCKKYVWKGPNF